MNSILNKLAPALLLFLLLSAHRASAFYDPGVQRWINRDPVGEMGFRAATKTTLPSDFSSGYLFSGNRPVNGFDAVGLSFAPPEVDENQMLAALGQCLGIAQRRLAEYRDRGKRGQNGPDADKWYHCVVSCEMTKVCGASLARTIANIHERLHRGDPLDTFLDQRANQTGRGCGGCEEKRSCEKCCEDNGYRR